MKARHSAGARDDQKRGHIWPATGLAMELEMKKAMQEIADQTLALVRARKSALGSSARLGQRGLGERLVGDGCKQRRLD